MIGSMMIGQLAASTGLSVRTLRFYADAGVLPARERAASGYRLFGPDAVARARLIRTLVEQQPDQGMVGGWGPTPRPPRADPPAVITSREARAEQSTESFGHECP